MKKTLAAVMAAALMTCALVPLSAGAASADSFTLSDLVKVAQYLTGRTTLTPAEEQEFDLTGDGEVTLSDLVQMAKDYEGGMPAAPTPAATSAPALAAVSMEEAQQTALGLVPGAAASNIVSSKTDTENGVPVYDIEILYDNAKYEFEIGASRPASQDAPTVYLQSMEKQPTSGYQGSQQTEQSAKDIVLSRVPGAAMSDFTEFKLDTDDGVQVYEGELRSNGYEYDFEIVQATGEVIKWSQQMHPVPITPPTVSAGPSPEVTPTTPSVSDTVTVSQQEAQQTALGLVPGATSSNIVSTRTDTENGVAIYDIEIVYDNAKHEFEIGAARPSSQSTPTVYLQSMEKRPTPGYQGSEQTEQSAKEIVLSRVRGAAMSDFTEFKLDTDDGVQVYEGELRSNGYDYDFEIVRATGEVIKWSQQAIYYAAPSSTPPATASPALTVAPTTPAAVPTQSNISADQAKQIAVDRIPGATLENVVSCNPETEDGRSVYDVKVVYGGASYEVDVLFSGDVKKQSMERRPTAGYQGTEQTEQSAKQIAVGVADGATLADVTSCKLETDDGVRVYEVELRVDGTEWDFTIVQATGEIIEQAMEVHAVPVPMPTAAPAPAVSPAPSAPPAATSPAFISGMISQDAAIDAALQRVPGATRANVVKCEMDTDDGVSVFEIEIIYGGREYDVVVSANSGQILDLDVDDSQEPTA